MKSAFFLMSAIVGLVILFVIFDSHVSVEKASKPCDIGGEKIASPFPVYLTSRQTTAVSSATKEANKRESTLPQLITDLQRRVYRERAEHSISKCYSRDTEHVAQLYVHKESKLAYCPVAKIGCTFWKRIFLFLHNDTANKKVDSPFQISRHFVHYGTKKTTKILGWTLPTQKMIQNYTRFLFGRDPYTRLWSAYLDKFFLPDFWRSTAGGVTKMRVNVSEKAARCHNDVTFEEFLSYVVFKSPKRMNEHWQPVKYRCDPCLLKPNIVGKQETFIDDAKYILDSIGYDWILSTFDYESFVKEELTMLIDYNFELLHDAFFKDCVDLQEMATLLWKVFQLNGYMPKDVPAKYVTEQLPEEFDKENFKTFVLETYRTASNENKRQWKLQKAEAVRNAYRSLPESLIQAIIELYKGDFEMFGYNTLPPGKEPNNI